MVIGEWLAVVVGIVCGTVLGLVPSHNRTRVSGWLALLSGLFVAAMNNELTVGWAYLLFDIPVVALSIVCGWCLVRYGGLLGVRGRHHLQRWMRLAT